jgi:hypothetical protein
MDDHNLNIWREASADLELDLDLSFSPGNDDFVLNGVILLHNFGSEKGMVIATDYNNLKQYIGKLNDLGYGYSVLKFQSSEKYNKDDFVEILSDWEWRGCVALRPNWLLEMKLDS